MAGNKNSGAPGVSRKAGPGRLPQRFTLKLGDKFGLSEKTADGKFLPMILATVVEIDRKCLVLETNENNRITLFR